MTAVIYARYSSDNQREESIEGQIRECTAYAEKNGITIVKHYIDRAISAKTDNRPEFQQMIKDSDKKLFDIVLVWKLDRFARNRYDSARYKTQLKKNGVKLMSATEIISEGPEGIILESVLEGYAEYYSADLAEKVVRGQTENILKGRCNGGRGTFGYTLDSERKFHIDPLASPFVLESFTKYRDGLTMKEIRDWLNENGIKNPVGGEFTYNSVEHMLKNRRYIGELKAAGSFPRGSDGSGRNKRKAEQNRRWKQRVGRTCAGAETAGTLYGYLASDWRTAAPGDAGSPGRTDADD